MDSIYILADVYEANQEGEILKLAPSNSFTSKRTELAIKEMFKILEGGKWKENDLAILQLINEVEEIMILAYKYNNHQWNQLNNLESITSKKLKTVYQSDEYLYADFTVQSWDDILANFEVFEQLDENKHANNTLLKTYSQFFHWYYLPSKGIFAPSKFLGYKDRTIDNYTSEGTGGETQIALKKYFNKLDKNSAEFKNLYQELKQISKNNFNKDLNAKIIDGTGGIYIPKDEYANFNLFNS